MRISIVLIISGVIFVIQGLNASDSLSSTFSRAFSGFPSDKSLWMLPGGLLLIAVGISGTFRFRKN